jgi:hypothetical protein
MIGRSLFFCSLALSALVVAGEPVPVTTTVRVAEDLVTLAVQRCGPPGTEFRAPDARFRDYYTPDEPHKWVRDGCVDYWFALNGAASARRSRDVVRVGRDVIAAADAWLLPVKGPARDEIRFELPDGVRVSTPWEPAGEQAPRFLADETSNDTEALVAFGRFNPRTEYVGATRLDIAMLDSSPPVDPADVSIWVTAAARQVTLAYGTFPVSRVQVLIVPVLGVWPNRSGPTLEAVPFARVMRNGGFTVQFFVNQTAPLAEYLADWTAPHEFSHLLLPYVRRTDAWVSEGFASYYQNVLMARAGVLDERGAWQKLWEGFERGRRERYDDTLDESMRRHGPNMLMRMYWSGAAVALMADVELRRASPPSSLDTLLATMRDCCLGNDRTWSGLELFQRFDEIAGRAVWVPLYRSTAQATEFPDVDPVLTQLGVRRVDGRVVLDDRAPFADIRQSIMAPRQGALSGAR